MIFDSETIYDFITESNLVFVDTSETLGDYDLIDVKVLKDESLGALCEYLSDYGSVGDVQSMLLNGWYGNFIDVYYLTDLEIYALAVGVR